MSITSIRAYDNTVLNTAISKSRSRVVPLMFALYFIAFIDRVNVGFAKDAISADIHLSQSAFALGAGIFFAAYAIFGVPANLLMNKFGARVWLSATAVVWGLLSASTGLVTNETQFVVLRFFLGLAEAGFYPGILLLASIYFPNNVRASVVAAFVLGVPCALTLGSPISAALLEMHGFLGRPGWFWMFMLEGLPATAIGVFTFFYLDDNPSTGRFLTQEEKDELNAQLEREKQKAEASSVKDAMKSIGVWHLAAIYGTLQIGVYGLLFFLPSQVAHLIGSALGFKASLVAAIPWAVSILGVYFIPRYADKKPGSRVSIAAANMIVAAIGLVISAFGGPVVAIAALCLCAVGFLAVQPIFWTFPPQILKGSALAAGIGISTSVGAFCSFVAPIIRVQVEEFFNSTHAGLIMLALFSLASATLILMLKGKIATSD
jgi:sugar phosphate permease